MAGTIHQSLVAGTMTDRALAAAAVSGMAAVTSTAFSGGKDASASVRRNLRDRDFVASLLGDLPGVDAADPRIACVLAVGAGAYFLTDQPHSLTIPPQMLPKALSCA